MNENLKALIIYHKNIHPSLTVQDVYKFLYQGTMGPQHIMNARETALSSLKEEFLKIKSNNIKDENLLEKVSIDGKVVRVNLRPYSKKSNDVELLFNIMETSVKNFLPDRIKLIRLWGEFKALVQTGKLDFDYKEVLVLDRIVDTKGDMHIRHSEIYRKREKPSYRVVLTKIFVQGSGFNI